MVHHVFVQILDFGPFFSKKISWKERSHGVPGGPSGHQAPCTRYPKRQPIDFYYYFRSRIFGVSEKSEKRDFWAFSRALSTHLLAQDPHIFLHRI